MQIHSLSDFTVTELAEVFNQSFTDYLLPIHLSPQQLSEKIRSENILLDCSVGVTIDNKLVAFIFTGIDKNGPQPISYNAGTGVIPEFRGQRLPQKMYGQLLPFLQESNIRRHLLEVITQNTKALGVYQKLGYKIARTVSCYKGRVIPATGMADFYFVRCTLDNEGLIRPFRNHQPTFQNTLSAINRNKELHETLGAFDGQQLIGYIIYAKNSGRIKQFGVHPDYRRNNIGHQLFYEVQKFIPMAAVTLINIDNGDTGTHAFLKKIGLDVFIEQYEMVLDS